MPTSPTTSALDALLERIETSLDPVETQAEIASEVDHLNLGSLFASALIRMNSNDKRREPRLLAAALDLFARRGGMTKMQAGRLLHRATSLRVELGTGNTDPAGRRLTEALDAAIAATLARGTAAKPDVEGVAEQVAPPQPAKPTVEPALLATTVSIQDQASAGLSVSTLGVFDAADDAQMRLPAKTVDKQVQAGDTFPSSHDDSPEALASALNALLFKLEAESDPGAAYLLVRMRLAAAGITRGLVGSFVRRPRVAPASYALWGVDAKEPTSDSLAALFERAEVSSARRWWTGANLPDPEHTHALALSLPNNDVLIISLRLMPHQAHPWVLESLVAVALKLVGRSTRIRDQI